MNGVRNQMVDVDVTYNGQEIPGSPYAPLEPKEFSTNLEFTVETPDTFLDFSSGGRSELLKSVIFWTMWNESSQGDYITHRPSSISACSEPGYQPSQGVEVTRIEHGEVGANGPNCFDWRFMYTWSMLNGFLNKERDPANPNKFLASRPFEYGLSNFSDSIGDSTYSNPPC